MTIETEPKRERTGGEPKSILSGLISPVEFQSAIKQFVEPGSSVTKLLMRTFFSDEREMNGAILLLRWVREYKLKDDESLLLDRIAAKTSIKGMRMHQLLQGVVGQLDGHQRGLKNILPKRKPHDDYLEGNE